MIVANSARLLLTKYKSGIKITLNFQNSVIPRNNIFSNEDFFF